MLEAADVAKARAKACFDLSEIPPSLLQEQGDEAVVYLKEVLDRVGLPPIGSVPTEDQMEAEGETTWRIPRTGLRIGLVEMGPKAGEYLFTPDTVDQLCDNYQMVLQAEYLDGATENWYGIYQRSPRWIRSVLPLRWLESLPAWTQMHLLKQTLWQWIGLVLGIGVAVGIFAVFRQVVGRLAKRGPRGEALRTLGTPVLIGLLTLALGIYVDGGLRITAPVISVVELTLLAIAYLMAAWAVIVLGKMIGRQAIESAHMKAGSVDSQLVRLLARLISVGVALTILVVGANHLGFPAYSIVTGLGVGGLAVALAARDSLANLFGSIVVMVEKPFRVGDWIKVGSDEGEVEEVGFRSTRIRTIFDSVISIPSSEILSARVDNMGVRRARFCSTRFKLSLDTPREKLQEFREGLHEILRTVDSINHEKFRGNLVEVTEISFDFEISYYVYADSKARELEVRERVLLEALELAERLEIAFAVPVRLIRESALHAEGVEEVPLR